MSGRKLAEGLLLSQTSQELVRYGTHLRIQEELIQVVNVQFKESFVLIEQAILGSIDINNVVRHLPFDPRTKCTKVRLNW